MPPTENQHFQQVIHRIDPQARFLRAWALTGGLSAQMTALEVLLPDGQHTTWVLRIPGDSMLRNNPDAAVDEFITLRTLYAANLPTQKLIDFDQSGAIFGRPYLVMQYIEGSPDYNPVDKISFARQVADALAKIHQISGQSLPFFHQTIFAEKIASRPVNSSPDEQRIRAVLASIGDAPKLNPSNLLHGDFWPGNLLWRDGHLAAVIDWEDVQIGDPLADFAISRFDLCFIMGLDAMQEFTRHYQSLTAFDFTALPYWDLYAALRAAPNTAEWTADYAALGRPDITDQSMRDSLQWFIAQALEKLHIP